MAWHQADEIPPIEPQIAQITDTYVSLRFN